RKGFSLPEAAAYPNNAPAERQIKPRSFVLRNIDTPSLEFREDCLLTAAQPMQRRRTGGFRLRRACPGGNDDWPAKEPSPRRDKPGGGGVFVSFPFLADQSSPRRDKPDGGGSPSSALKLSCIGCASSQ